MALSAGLTLALSDYLAQTRRLLKDPNSVLYTDQDLTEFINRSIRERDLALGLNRIRVSFTLVSGTYAYSFATIVATGTVINGNPNGVVQDLLSIMLMPLGGATTLRYPLGRWPYTKLAFMLSTTYPTYPTKYAIYGGEGNVIFGPPPAGNYPVELDFIAYSPDLVNTTDRDFLPYPFTDPVPFMAAAFAKMNAQRFDEADQFEKTFTKRLNTVRGRARAIQVASPWSDIVR